MKVVEQEKRDLRQANEILRKAWAYIAMALTVNASILLPGKSRLGRPFNR